MNICYPNKEKRKLITKFRISDHDLLIETGRYKNIPREQRCCTVCNILDDESHFFFNHRVQPVTPESGSNAVFPVNVTPNFGIF